MNKKDFENLVLTRQACREFNDKPLEEQVVLDIAELALNTPSACNSQPWHMYCATSEKSLQAVTKALTGGGRNLFLNKAKAYIVVTEKATTLKEDVLKMFSLDHFVKYDIGELVAYITLGAKSMGVDSVIIGWMDQQELGNAIGMGEGEKCALAIALGYSDIPTRQKKRFPKEQIIKVL